MTSINNNQRSSGSSSPVQTTGTTTASGAPPELDDAEAFDTSLDPDLVDDMSLRADLTTPSPRADVAAAAAKEAMSGLFVSDADVDTAVKALESLPGGEARAALETMQKDGSFTTLLKQADGTERRRLTELLIDTGLVGSTTPTYSHEPGPGGPTPPAPPTLPVPPKAVSMELKAMLHDENIARATSYRGEHRDYVDTYRDAIRTAPNIASLRRVGELVEPTMPIWEPGTPHTEARTDWADVTRRAPDTRTGAIITAKLYELLGEVPPGVDSDISGKAKFIFHEQLSVTASANYGEDRYGNTTAGASLTGAAAVGNATEKIHGTGTVGVTTKNGEVTEATTTATGGFSSGTTREKRDADGREIKDLATSTLSEKTHKSDFAIGGSSGSVEVGKGKATAEIDAGVRAGFNFEEGKAATITIGAAFIAATAGIVEHGGMYGELEAKRKFALNGMAVEVQVSLKQTVQLSSVLDYERFTAVIESGVFETPGELKRGVKWDALNHGAKAAYTLYGWDKASWQAEQLGLGNVMAGRIAGR